MVHLEEFSETIPGAVGGLRTGTFCLVYMDLSQPIALCRFPCRSRSKFHRQLCGLNMQATGGEIPLPRSRSFFVPDEPAANDGSTCGSTRASSWSAMKKVGWQTVSLVRGGSAIR